jgi:hypothetical protein
MQWFDVDLEDYPSKKINPGRRILRVCSSLQTVSKKKPGFSKMIFHCKNGPKEINFGNIKQQFTKRGENRLNKQIDKIYKNCCFHV